MTQTVTVTGGDLFHVAAIYLQDATQANRIAAANNLADFFITGQVTLVIPEVDPTQAGGVPSQ